MVSRAEPLAAAWGESAVTDHSLTEAIRILRRALGDDARRPRYIQTVHNELQEVSSHRLVWGCGG